MKKNITIDTCNDFFANKAHNYEANDQRVDNVDKIANAIITSARLSEDMHLMDFGSGTGLLLERIAPYVNKITAVDISGAFDGIISSMTMHHVKDVEAMFGKFYSLLKEGGFIAISDPDQEDGSLHTEDTGVCHFGFGRPEIEAMATKAGFQEVATLDASVARKPHGDFGVFLLLARR